MLKRSAMPAVYLAVVFICGGAAGVFGERFYQARHVSPDPPRPTPEQWKRRHLEELQSKLNLTPDQYQKISSILDDTRSQMHALMERTRPEMERIQKDQYARVHQVLSPDQAAQYDRIHAEHERHRREQRPPFPPPSSR